MKKKLLVTAALSIMATGAMAQSNPPENPFAGPSVGISVSSASGGTDFFTGTQSVVPTIEVGYAYGVSKEIALGLTATYDLADTRAGSSGNPDLVGNRHWSVNFKPGYVLGSTTMIYALVGYHTMEGTLNNNGVVGTSNINGMGYGLGIEALLDKNLYVRLEGQTLRYLSTTTAGLTYKPSTSLATLGLGYKF
jgi:opacity protein-like surface antigen